MRLTAEFTPLAEVQADWLIVGVWEEGPFPESVAHSVMALRDVSPPDPKVLQADPVLLFSFSQVSPGDTREISYKATVTGTGSPTERLAHLKGDQQAAEASFYRQNAIVVSQLQTLTITPSAMAIPTGQSVTVTLAGQTLTTLVPLRRLVATRQAA